MDRETLDALGAIIDKACDERNKEELEFIVNKYSDEYVETLDDEEIRIHLYYYLANAWSGLKDILHEKNQTEIWKFEQKEIFNAIYYYRKAISASCFDAMNIEMKTSIYTNIGNIFNHYGRTIIALKYYNKALKLSPNFFMALANKAICLETYANLEYDIGHKDLMYREALSRYKEANLEIKKYIQQYSYNNEYYKNIYDMVHYRSSSIKEFFTHESLDESINIDYCELGESTEEREITENGY